MMGLMLYLSLCTCKNAIVPIDVTEDGIDT